MAKDRVTIKFGSDFQKKYPVYRIKKSRGLGEAFGFFSAYDPINSFTLFDDGSVNFGSQKDNFRKTPYRIESVTIVKQEEPVE